MMRYRPRAFHLQACRARGCLRILGALFERSRACAHDPRAALLFLDISVCILCGTPDGLHTSSELFVFPVSSSSARHLRLCPCASTSSSAVPCGGPATPRNRAGGGGDGSVLVPGAGRGGNDGFQGVRAHVFDRRFLPDGGVFVYCRIRCVGVRRVLACNNAQRSHPLRTGCPRVIDCYVEANSCGWLLFCRDSVSLLTTYVAASKSCFLKHRRHHPAKGAGSDIYSAHAQQFWRCRFAWKSRPEPHFNYEFSPASVLLWDVQETTTRLHMRRRYSRFSSFHYPPSSWVRSSRTTRRYVGECNVAQKSGSDVGRPRNCFVRALSVSSRT